MKRRQTELTNTRVVCHIDMDCFYVQVERGINPALIGRPVGVSQYNPFGDLKTVKPTECRIDISNGSLIAVSYEARAQGVKRNMRGAEAKTVCPDLVLVQVPTDHGKADLNIYREAGAKVVAILGKVIKSAIIEKASIDEVYLDVTEEATRRLAAVEDDVAAFNALIAAAKASSIAGEDAVEMKMSKNILRKGHSGTKKDDDVLDDDTPNVRDWFDQPYYMWNQDDKLLLCGAIICDELRLEVLKQLKYSCSGGVAHNKMLSKIASAMHKPNRQTLVPACVVKNMMSCIPINRVAGFGGKLGDSLADFNGRKIEKFSDIIEIGREELSGPFGEECAIWMLNAAAGVDHTPVEQRALTASIGCGKSYRQKNTLPPASLHDGRVLHWLRELSEELEERVQMDTEMNSRKPKQITVGLSIAYVQPPKDPNATVEVDVVKKWHETQGMSLSKVGPMCVGALATSKAAHAMACKAVADSTRLNKPWNITYISLSASGFVPIANESHAISSFFRVAQSPLKVMKKDAKNISGIDDIDNKNENKIEKYDGIINNTGVSSFSSSPFRGNLSSPPMNAHKPIEVENISTLNSESVPIFSIQMEDDKLSDSVKETNFSLMTGNISETVPQLLDKGEDNDLDESNSNVGFDYTGTQQEECSRYEDDREDMDDNATNSIREISSYYNNTKSGPTNAHKNDNNRDRDNNSSHGCVNGNDSSSSGSNNRNNNSSTTSPATTTSSTTTTTTITSSDNCSSSSSSSSSNSSKKSIIRDDSGSSSSSGTPIEKDRGSSSSPYNDSDNMQTSSSTVTTDRKCMYTHIEGTTLNSLVDVNHSHDNGEGIGQGVFTVNRSMSPDIAKDQYTGNCSIETGSSNKNGNNSSSNSNWNIMKKDLDMEVFNSLPLELQRELSLQYNMPFDDKLSIRKPLNSSSVIVKGKAKGSVLNKIKDANDRTPLKVSSFFNNSTTTTSTVSTTMDAGRVGEDNRINGSDDDDCVIIENRFSPPSLTTSSNGSRTKDYSDLTMGQRMDLKMKKANGIGRFYRK